MSSSGDKPASDTSKKHRYLLRGPPSKEVLKKARVRAERAAELLMQGMSIPKIAHTLEEEFGVSYKTGCRDAGRGRKLIGEACTKIPFEHKLIDAVAKAEHLASLAISQGKLETALNTLKWLGELHGLTARQRSEHDPLVIQINQLQSELQAARTGGERRSALNLAQYNILRSRYGMPGLTGDQWADRTKRHINLELPEHRESGSNGSPGANGGNGKAVIDTQAEGVGDGTGGN